MFWEGSETPHSPVFPCKWRKCDLISQVICSEGWLCAELCLNLRTALWSKYFHLTHEEGKEERWRNLLKVRKWMIVFWGVWTNTHLKSCNRTGAGLGLEFRAPDFLVRILSQSTIGSFPSHLHSSSQRLELLCVRITVQWYLSRVLGASKTTS
jgi:hypothetical protein